MNDNNDVLQRIRAEYKTFSKGQKRIADYIEQHYEKTTKMTATKLGEASNVSESTVVRFATQLGYEGYPEFQKALQKRIKNKINSVQRLMITYDELTEDDACEMVLKTDIENLKRTYEEMDKDAYKKAANMIVSSRHIYIVAGRSTNVLSEFIKHYLSYIIDDIRVVESGNIAETLEEMYSLGKEDTVIGISFPRYSANTSETLKYSKQTGAGIIAITDSDISPISSLADVCLYAKSDMASIADSLVAPLSVVNALITTVSMLKKEETIATMSRMEKLWAEYGVYGPDSGTVENE